MSLPALQIRKEEGGSFTVRATWPDGAFEEVAGFTSETEANEWITNKFSIWLKEQEKARA
jgi:hypothetical protein